MTWNNGYKRKQFEQFEEKQAAEYRRAGMSEEAIREMYLFDCDLYRRERIFVGRTQPLINEDECDCETRNALCKNFLDAFSVQMIPFEDQRYGWIEQIENQTLYEALVDLEDEQKELLTLIYIYGYRKNYIARNILHIPATTLSDHLSKIYEKISLSFLEKEDNINA